VQVPSSKEDKTQLAIALALLVSFGIALVLLGMFGKLSWCWLTACDMFQSREALRIYIESWGAWAPVVFIFIQAFQVIVAPIPGELTGAVGGFVFGAIPNVIYSTVGLTLGSVGAFLVSRIVGLPIVKLAVSQKLLEKFYFLTKRRGTVVSLALFTIPGFPKDILCFILGLSPMGFVTFVIVCSVGRIPGTIMLSLSGSAVFDENWGLLGIVSVVCLLSIGFFFFAHNKIELWIKTRHS
jgi:uncharacterized membrane protein YdjX (TVP38/TMEM64 family)